MRKTFNPDAFNASICLGLQEGYTGLPITTDIVINKLQFLQKELIREKQVYLSANCFNSIIVLSGQKEPHLNIEFFNYPKFPMVEKVFKESVEWIAERLMIGFKQNRLVIQFHDGNLMLEISDKIDPSIEQ